MKNLDYKIVLLRIALGALFLSIGIDKITNGWVSSDSALVTSLNGYLEKASGFQKQYLEIVAFPYAAVWAKMISLGEAAIGISLILGLLARTSSAIGIVMVLNLHAANGNLYSMKLFQTPWGVLVLICFLYIVVARAGRTIGLDYYLAKSNAKSIFW